MKKFARFLIIVAVLLLTVGLGSQLIYAKNYADLKDMLGAFCGPRPTPADVADTLKNGINIGFIHMSAEDMLRYLGVPASQRQMSLLTMHAFAVSPYTILSGAICMLFSMVFFLAGRGTRREARR